MTQGVHPPAYGRVSESLAALASGKTQILMWPVIPHEDRKFPWGS